MKRKYDLVSSLYIDLFEKRDNYQNHIRTLSTSTSVIEDKRPDPPARLGSRKNRYMEMQKKFYQLGVENSKAVSSLSNYSKYKNPKIFEPGSNTNSNKPTRIDWLKPYNSTPLPPLKTNKNLFKKNHKNIQPFLIEDNKKTKKNSNGNSNKISNDDDKQVNNNSIEKNDINTKKSKNATNTKQAKDIKSNIVTDKNDEILYLTEPNTKDSERMSETRKEGALENTISSVSNKLISNIDNEMHFENSERDEKNNKNTNFENSKTEKSEKEFSDEIYDDFENNSSTNQKDDDSDEKEFDDFEKESSDDVNKNNTNEKESDDFENESNISTFNKSNVDENKNAQKGKIETVLNKNSNLLLENTNKNESEDIEMENTNGQSNTEDFNLKDSESSKEEENDDKNDFEIEDLDQNGNQNDDDEFENFEIE